MYLAIATSGCDQAPPENASGDTAATPAAADGQPDPQEPFGAVPKVAEMSCEYRVGDDIRNLKMEIDEANKTIGGVLADDQPHQDQAKTVTNGITADGYTSRVDDPHDKRKDGDHTITTYTIARYTGDFSLDQTNLSRKGPDGKPLQSSSSGACVDMSAATPGM